MRDQIVLWAWFSPGPNMCAGLLNIKHGAQLATSVHELHLEVPLALLPSAGRKALDPPHSPWRGSCRVPGPGGAPHARHGWRLHAGSMPAAEYVESHLSVSTRLVSLQLCLCLALASTD